MDLAGDMDLAEDFVDHVVAARRRDAPPRAGDARARRGARSSGCASPFPRITYGEAIDAAAAARASPSSGAPTSAPTRRRAISERVRPPGAGAPLPGRVQGVLHEGRPRRPARRAVRRHARAGGLRRDHRRRPARGRPGDAARRKIRAARAARGGVRAGTSTCAATARCRTPASAWASSAWSPGCAACSTCARRSPSRACWSGSRRRPIHHRGAPTNAAGAPPESISVPRPRTRRARRRRRGYGTDPPPPSRWGPAAPGD